MCHFPPILIRAASLSKLKVSLGDGQLSLDVSIRSNLSVVLPLRLFHEKNSPVALSLFAPTLQVAHNVPDGKPKFTNG